MRQITQLAIKLYGETIIRCRKGEEFLKLKYTHNRLELWLTTEANAEIGTLRFLTLREGCQVPEGYSHVGTVFSGSGEDYHVFIHRAAPPKIGD